jgi:hypothetical protein
MQLHMQCLISIYDGIHNIRSTESINVKTHSDSNKTNSEKDTINMKEREIKGSSC